MILCHKCSGLLTQIDNPALQDALGGCRCMSGYVRDWQVGLTEQQAITKAIEHSEAAIRWLSSRNAKGDPERIIACQERIAKLRNLVGK